MPHILAIIGHGLWIVTMPAIIEIPRNKDRQFELQINRKAMDNVCSFETRWRIGVEARRSLDGLIQAG